MRHPRNRFGYCLVLGLNVAWCLDVFRQSDLNASLPAEATLEYVVDAV